MKYLYYILIVLLFLPVCVVAQQNLVPNGNFEEYTTCPTASSQMSNCTGWSSWTTTTPDYFNVCAPSSPGIVGVPINLHPYGYQWPHSGNAYAGIWIQIQTQTYTNREYITRSITPLQVGATYEVSLSINSSNRNRWSHDDVGVFFFDNGPSFIATNTTVILNPQVDYSGNGTFADTLNWMRLVKTFTADSTYDNIVIGALNILPTYRLTRQVQTKAGIITI